MNWFNFFILLFLFSDTIAQNWKAESKASVPEPVSNNAVCAAKVNGNTYIYSFAGTGPGKQYNDIHGKAFWYDPANTDYIVFGGSGTITGDTIWYMGGARMGKELIFFLIVK